MAQEGSRSGPGSFREAEPNPVTSMLQAKRALRVIAKIEQARAVRRQTAEATEAGGSGRLQQGSLKPRAVSVASPITAAGALIPLHSHTSHPLQGVEVHRLHESGSGSSNSRPNSGSLGPTNGSFRNRVLPEGKSTVLDRESGQEITLAKARWRQACSDIQAARAHLRVEHGDKPTNPEELWAVYNQAGGRLTGEAPIPEHPRYPRSHWRYYFSPASDARALKALFLESWLNVLLITAPFGWASHFAGWDPYATFILNLVALIPLAMVIGKLTEDLATRWGDTIGGLLNVTFGNAVELILSIVALFKRLYIVVEYSLIGSVLSNTLLVLGTCFLLGGMKYKEQTFNAVANKASASLLFLAAIALIVPTGGSYLYGTVEISESEILNVSYTTAIILILIYVGYLYFQLRTHHSLFMEEENEEEPVFSTGMAICLLGTVTVLVAFASEWLTDSLTEVSERSGISEAFIGLIILPIAGNAVEHLTAVYVAVRNKMDLAIAVALGSSIQISIFVIPILVLVGWAANRPLSLAFDPFLVMVLTLSVIHAQFVSSDGRSNWMMGLQLIGTYVLVAVLIAHL